MVYNKHLEQFKIVRLKKVNHERWDDKQFKENINSHCQKYDALMLELPCKLILLCVLKFTCKWKHVLWLHNNVPIQVW